MEQEGRGMTAKLKPCPFCGSSDVYLGCLKSLHYEYISCHSCHIEFSNISMDENEPLAKAWNRRLKV